MKYRIGQVGRILNLSSESLRFFEKEGIVVPSRGDGGSYRFFDYLDVNKLVAYRQYRRMGFSLAEARRLVSRCRMDDLEGSLERRSGELAAELLRTQRTLERIGELRRSFADYRRLGDRFESVDRQAYLFFGNQANEDFLMGEAELRATHRWLDELPFAAPTVYVADGNRRWGFSKPLTLGSETPPDGCIVIEAATCLHAFFLVEAAPNSLDAPLKRLSAAATARGGVGRVFGSMLHELEVEGTTRWLFELFASL